VVGQGVAGQTLWRDAVERLESNMVTALEKPLYTAEATAVGGRQGHVRSSDGLIDVDLQPPVEMGGPGGATNPEELFAAGFSACFQSALGVVARRKKVIVEGSTVAAKVTIGTVKGGGFGLAVALEVHIPDVDATTTQTLIEDAHAVCPYSNATRGNIEVTLAAV
jgi:lipoyl-dependent peroxiredoxin